MKKTSKSISNSRMVKIIQESEKEHAKGLIPTLSKPLSPEDRIKKSLCKIMVEYLVEHDLQAKDLVDLLAINKARVSEILNYKYGRFSIDRLVQYVDQISRADKLVALRMTVLYELLEMRADWENLKRVERTLADHA